MGEEDMVVVVLEVVVAEGKAGTLMIGGEWMGHREWRFDHSKRFYMESRDVIAKYRNKEILPDILLKSEMECGIIKIPPGS